MNNRGVNAITRGNRGIEVKRLGILISGRGSNMMALAAAIADGRIPGARIALVVSNVATAAGLAKAGELGLETIVLDHRGKRREEHDRAMADALSARGVDLVCLAGYMRLLSPWFVRAFEHRILNIHPSLLPSFPGLDAQRQALDYGVTYTGCTVHLVDEQLDHGPIIEQAVVEIRPGETLESLSARILKEEHRIYPRAVARLLSGKWSVSGRKLVPAPQSG
jgi:phosphoribosylglycinamide formyltransferase-1